MLLSGFFSSLEANNVFTRYDISRGHAAGVFARHDYQPKITFCENNVWGTKYGRGIYVNAFEKVVQGKAFLFKPYDMKQISAEHGEYRDPVRSTNITLMAKSSASLNVADKIDFVITDPPYASNVNYAELADFFYVWLRLLLAKIYSSFTPHLTPKKEEIIENPTRGKTVKDFEEGITQVF